MSYTNHVLGSIPFGTLIGAPLTAAVEAQALAAQSSVQFIKAIGFEPPAANSSGTSSASPTAAPDIGAIRNITFTYRTRRNGTSPDQPSTERDATLTVPLLTIVPIPYLRIDEMTIDFTTKITEEMNRETTNSSDVNFNASADLSYGKFLSPVSVSLKASVSTKHSSTASTSNRYKTEHTMNIHVRAVQDDLPAGLTRILDIMESAISEKR